jgi:hypothetical protein
LKLKTSKTIFIIVLLLSICFIGLYQIPQVHATTIFSDGFESNNFNAWTGTDYESPSSQSVQSTTVYDGTYAASFVGAAGWHPTYAYKTITSATTLYTRIYYRTNQLPDSDTNWQVILQHTQTGQDFVVGYGALVELYNNAGTVVWAIKTKDDDGTIVTTLSSVTPTVNTWCCVELYTFAGTGANGEVHLFVNDAEIASKTGMNTDVYFAITSVRVGSTVYAGSTATHIIDCVVVADAYIGPISATSVNHYVNGQNSQVDSVADVGTHSNFTAQQQAPVANNPYNDTLTEGQTNTASTSFGNPASSGTSYTSPALNYLSGGMWTSGSTAATAYNITFFGSETGTGTRSVKGVICNSSGYILTNGVGAAVTVSGTTGAWYTSTFSTPPTISPSTNYTLMLVSDSAGFRLFYSSTSGGTEYVDTTNSYTTPTNPTDWSQTNATNYRVYSNTSWTSNYQLGLEEQFTSIPTGYTSRELDLFMGTWTTAETIGVQGWNPVNSTWTTITASLTQNQWNNASVTAWMDSLNTTFTIRFYDGTQSSDTVQSAWSKDSCLLHLWNATAGASYAVTCIVSASFGVSEYMQTSYAKVFSASATFSATQQSTATYNLASSVNAKYNTTTLVPATHPLTLSSSSKFTLTSVFSSIYNLVSSASGMLTLSFLPSSIFNTLFSVANTFGLTLGISSLFNFLSSLASSFNLNLLTSAIYNLLFSSSGSFSLISSLASVFHVLSTASFNVALNFFSSSLYHMLSSVMNSFSLMNGLKSSFNVASSILGSFSLSFLSTTIFNVLSSLSQTFSLSIYLNVFVAPVIYVVTLMASFSAGLSLSLTSVYNLLFSGNSVFSLVSGLTSFFHVLSTVAFSLNATTYIASAFNVLVSVANSFGLTLWISSAFKVLSSIGSTFTLSTLLTSAFNVLSSLASTFSLAPYLSTVYNVLSSLGSTFTLNLFVTRFIGAVVYLVTLSLGWTATLTNSLTSLYNLLSTSSAIFTVNAYFTAIYNILGILTGSFNVSAITNSIFNLIVGLNSTFNLTLILNSLHTGIVYIVTLVTGWSATLTFLTQSAFNLLIANDFKTTLTIAGQSIFNVLFSTGATFGLTLEVLSGLVKNLLLILGAVFGLQLTSLPFQIRFTEDELVAGAILVVIIVGALAFSLAMVWRKRDQD